MSQRNLIFNGDADKDSASINLHFQGEFNDCREALKQAIKALQVRLDNQESCPYFTPEEETHLKLKGEDWSFIPAFFKFIKLKYKQNKEK